MDEPAEEQYLPVEEIAERLGLPLSVLLRRVEAGDVPSRRTDTDSGPRYALRLSDLGIEPDPPQAPSGDRDNHDDAESGGINSFDGEERTVPVAAGDMSEHEILQPAWSTRPVEPRQPPVWITAEPHAATAEHGEMAAHPSDPSEIEPDPAEASAAQPDSAEPGAAPEPAIATPEEEEQPAAQVAEAASEPALHVATPEPARSPASSLIDPLSGGPRSDLASMSLDARDLVAGLLDRWERTLEQRIYTEQRQRFQVELSARQNMVRELQMELQTARAEHAAAQAEKDRLLAAKERELADRERDLAETRRYVEETERGTPSSEPPRRRWFRPRGDD